MHIMLIHQAFAALDEAGGTRHYEMAQYLVNRGHQVTIISSPVSYLSGSTRPGKNTWKSVEKPESGLTIIRAYTFASLHKSFVKRVYSFLSFMVSSFSAGLSVQKVDLVWGTSPPIFQGLTAWMLARLKGVPFLFEIRDLWPAFAIAVGVLKNKHLIWLSEKLEQFLYRHADQLIINSPGFISHLTERGAKSVVLVPNSADPGMFSGLDAKSGFLKPHNLDGKFIVMYAGAHGLSNDLATVLQAAKLLSDQKNIHFVFVGDGKEKPALMIRADDLKLDTVTFLPSQPKTMMSEVLASADACIAILKPIELYRTTYPNKVFDYMAAGRAVILAIGGVISDVVIGEGAGIAVPPGDSVALAMAVKTLAENPSLTKKMGQAGRIAVERRYNRNATSEQLALLIEKMGR